MTPRRRLMLGHLVLVPVTAAAFLTVLVVTSFLACGISGCGGGGFGPSFSPVEAQAGLLACGATLLPLTLLVLRGQARAHVAVAGAAVVLSGAFLAMVVLDLGPHGCPADQQRAVAGAQAWDPGAPTCSADRHAVPASAG
jgi:hypothetical protein